MLSNEDKTDIVAAIITSAKILDTPVEEESYQEMVAIWVNLRKMIGDVYAAEEAKARSAAKPHHEKQAGR